MVLVRFGRRFRRIRAASSASPRSPRKPPASCARGWPNAAVSRPSRVPDQHGQAADAKRSPDGSPSTPAVRALPVPGHQDDHTTRLRHTAAMRLLHAGVDTTVIALWLGNSHWTANPTATARPTRSCDSSMGCNRVVPVSGGRQQRRPGSRVSCASGEERDAPTVRDETCFATVAVVRGASESLLRFVPSEGLDFMPASVTERGALPEARFARWCSAVSSAQARCRSFVVESSAAAGVGARGHRWGSGARRERRHVARAACVAFPLRVRRRPAAARSRAPRGR